jgi:hypothetical protein
MILLAALLQAAAPPSVEPDQEILVMARRLQLIEVDIRAPRKAGLVTLKSCRITRPSNIAELDAIPCGVAQECVAAGLPTRKALQQCVEQRSGERIAALVAARRAAR